MATQSGIHCCAPAPIFHPSHEEWKDFASYVRSIEPSIREYGGCQIVPPPEWAHFRASGATSPRQQLERRLSEHEGACIKPIKQHVAGRDGRFSAVMELLDPTKLSDFLAAAAEAPAAVRAAGPEECDARFWRGVAGGAPANYGADASELGSLFDASMDEWNLGALPGGPEHDLTQSLPMAIPGLNRSMLYIGQWRSFFAMHTEDCELQGASYLHWGAPKRW